MANSPYYHNTVK